MFEIQENISLSRYTTFKTGGCAKYFTVVKSVEDLKKAVIFAERKSLPFFVLGGGSNLLVSDDGVDGLVIKMEIKGIEFREEVQPREGVERSETTGEIITRGEILNKEIVRVIATAGEIWDDLVKQCVERDLYGVENLSYIPGTVGASVVQNIGAYGAEVKDVVDWVEVFDTKTGKTTKLAGTACKFGYRDSMFKKLEGKNLIVVRVAYRLQKNGELKTDYKDIQGHLEIPKTPKQLRKIIIEIRKNKLPNWREVSTAGSFFKNPVINKEQLKKIKDSFSDIPVYPLGNQEFKVSLAYLLDKFGWKEKGNNVVGVYEKQPLVLVNYGGGTTADIKNFSEKIIKEVKEKIGLSIELEVVEW